MKIWKLILLSYIGGMIYVGLELVWRGWSHGSMFVVGGICFVLIGSIDKVFPGMPLFMQSVLGALVVTTMELCSGLFLNVYLRLGVWDYSRLPYNLMGQVCMAYFFLWIFVSMAAVVLDGFLRKKLFGEEKPAYRFA